MTSQIMLNWLSIFEELSTHHVDIWGRCDLDLYFTGKHDIVTLICDGIDLTGVVPPSTRLRVVPLEVQKTEEWTELV